MQIPNYEIITTLGPSSNTTQVWESFAESGATGFRINTSHLSLQQLREWLEKLQPFLSSYHLPLVLDLQGSKWRLGRFTPFELLVNNIITLIYGETTDQPDILPVPHPDFFQAALQSTAGSLHLGYRSQEIIMNDAKIILQIETASRNRVTARVQRGGMIAPQKGITLAASEYRLETLSAKDRAIVDMTSSIQNIRYAISYVRDAMEMERYRSVLGTSLYIIAKLERKTALDDALKIANIADELWLCRGDLGAESGLAALVEQVYQFTIRVPDFTKPVLMAGQVLEHMTEHATPTRSEICYLYETLIRGYQGIVLSDETAIGVNPVDSCKTAAIFKSRETVKSVEG